MTKYKLVPMEPTPAMVQAAEEAYMPFGDMELAIQMAILEAPEHPADVVAPTDRGIDQSLARDAARYRWLMRDDFEWPEEVDFAIECQNRSKIDAMIDAAMASEDAPK